MEIENVKSKSRIRYERYKHSYQEYYLRNKDKIRAKQKAYQEHNKDKIKEGQKREKYKATRKRWFLEHREQVKEYQYKYYREVVKPKTQALQAEKRHLKGIFGMDI